MKDQSSVEFDTGTEALGAFLRHVYSVHGGRHDRSGILYHALRSSFEFGAASLVLSFSQSAVCSEFFAHTPKCDKDP